MKRLILALFLAVAAAAWGLAYYGAESALVGDPPRGSECSGNNC
jgi:hypothetical protein